VDYYDYYYYYYYYYQYYYYCYYYYYSVLPQWCYHGITAGYSMTHELLYLGQLKWW